MNLKYSLLAAAVTFSLAGCSTSAPQDSQATAKAVINQEYLDQNPDAIKQARQKLEAKRQQAAKVAQLELNAQLESIRLAQEQEALKAKQEKSRILAQTATYERSLQEESTRLKQLKHKQDVLEAEKSARVEAVKAEEKRRFEAAAARKEYMDNAPTYYLYPGESYQTAIARWLRSEGYETIAWADDSNLTDALGRSAPADNEIRKFHTYIHSAIDELKQSSNALIKAGLSITLDKNAEIASVHPWANRRVQMTYVDGGNLREAVKAVVKSYHWNWNELNSTDGSKITRSWGPKYELPFSSPYPIVTPEGDIDAALQTVLKGYPVKAGRLDSTRHIYINEEQL